MGDLWQRRFIEGEELTVEETATLAEIGREIFGASWDNFYNFTEVTEADQGEIDVNVQLFIEKHFRRRALSQNGFRKFRKLV